MKEIKRTKYLIFYLAEEKPKTNVYSIRNRRSGEELATISWYSSWMQYVMETSYFRGEIIWNDGCLKEVVEFLQWLREEHKKKRASNEKLVKPKDNTKDN